MTDPRKIIEELHNIRKRLEDRDHTEWSRNVQMRRLWRVISGTIELDVVNEVVRHSQYTDLSRLFRREWRTYLSDAEERHAVGIINGMPAASMAKRELYFDEVDEFSLLTTRFRDFEFVMIGCGPFPETLTNVCRRQKPFARAVGVDSSERSLQFAQKLVHRMIPPSDRTSAISFCHCLGENYNYSKSSVVFLANGIVGKKRTLARIGATMAPGGIVLLRNPHLLATLIYEDILDSEEFHRFQLISSVKSSVAGATYALQK